MIEAQTSVLGTLGIDWRLLLAQLVNVGIVLLAVRWLMKKLIPVMEERARVIAEGLQNADDAKRLRAESEKEKEALLNATRAEVRDLLANASIEAEAVKAKKLAAMKVELEKIASDAKDQIRSERDTAFASLKSDVARLVVTGMEQLSVNMTEKDRKQFLQKGMKDIS